MVLSKTHWVVSGGFVDDIDRVCPLRHGKLHKSVLVACGSRDVRPRHRISRLPVRHLETQPFGLPKTTRRVERFVGVPALWRGQFPERSLISSAVSKVPGCRIKRCRNRRIKKNSKMQMEGAARATG